MPSKRRIRGLSIIAASLLASASLAHAAGFEGYYFAGYMGLNTSRTLKLSPKETPAKPAGDFAGALGFHLAPHWRLEGEVALHDDEISRVSFNEDNAPLGRFKSWSGLVNIYRDFETPGKLKPFVSAGAGYIAEEPTGSGARQNGGFAWQFGGGLQYSFDPSLSFSSAYRYLDSAETGLDAREADQGHQLRVGLNYKLPYRPKHHPRGLNDTGK